ncbi:CDP-diacylglycerol--glycerol-3-phosphate 3-phosphatidyltransferase [Pseudoroseomonas deserti]|uniref:CDP-diacylglycerol--glycerol-3-phosphate 3-phosphatidyltransferase n=1 Tax=Teichococcus deserti TaxID=1817963 RepID=A0A1V2H8S6_9PROT|nr:CDP-alcohol phosphatidyltransferase family protein [Pseudoroseomonas deserti]ONG58884.1 CDP-diacylglycerol--glycerol-3-phosphate 3-phosphatidyltransferase [Pseudoroseomonas deserti]
MTDPGDRRPIAARNLAVMERLAGWLIRQEASPNAISGWGMVAGLGAGLALAATAWAPGAAWLFWLLGALGIQLRLLANLLDGMVAVGRGVTSPVGELWNEVPDRVSDSAVLLGLGVAAGSWGLGAAAALAAMATAYLRAMGKAAGAPSDFRGPMAKQQRMALCTALAVWCALVPASWSHGIQLPVIVLWVILAGSLLTCWRRLSGTARALRGGRA